MLVTGAGGSIGSELCRQVHRLNPSRLYMLDHDETLLQAVQMDVQGNGLLNSSQLLLADIREPGGMHSAMTDADPDIVFHAAAHKHLTLLENNPSEAARTNVLGTRNVVRAAVEHGVERLINISTDKAADPTSVLGATKRAAEMLIQMYTPTECSLASVRFGNVLGSRGSFLPLLREQINQGQPVTVTDPAVERFFMTIPQAAGLVIAAAGLASDGETFVLDMGEPVKIMDLISRYVELSGCQPPEIIFTGLRPGEKLSEVVFSKAENPVETSRPGIWRGQPTPLAAGFLADFQILEDVSAHNDSEQTLKQLHHLVASYH